MKNPFVRPTSETERLRKSLGDHLAQLRRLLSAPDRDATNSHIFIAGHLRTLLCDQYPVLLRYAKIQGHDLRIWGPKFDQPSSNQNLIMSVTFLVASYDPNSLMLEMSVEEYLKTSIGVANFRHYTPTDIIKLLANKEGAAHLEPIQNELLEDIKTAFVVSVPVAGFDATDDFILRNSILQIAEWCVRTIEKVIGVS